MKIRSVYRQDAACVTPADTLQEAARRMRASGQSVLPVLDGGQVIGIVTERDLVEAVANGVAGARAQVFSYTNDGSVTVTLDDECDVAEMKMLAIGCRHIPVVAAGQLVGMVSIRDVLLKTAAAGHGYRGTSVPAWVRRA
jgi:CBS domain-containing protein